MKRFTKTTMVALAIVAGTTSGALAQKKWIKVDPVTKDLYQFTYLNHGNSNIKVEVIDKDEEDVININDIDEVFMVARISKIDNEKAKVTVRGEFIGPVSVNIYDNNDVLVLAEYIDHDKEFSKVYDLSIIDASELRIEVSTNEKLLAAVKF